MKRIEDLVFTDDYMFGAVMRNPDICKKVLERVLKIRIDHLEYPELQKAIKPYYESKGVRLDVYVKDSNQVFDIEVQSSEPADLGRRTRYYQSMVDIDSLARGMVYETLPNSYILFFCKKDWLHNNLPVSTYKTICSQNTKLILNDGCSKTFLCAELWEKESDIEIQAFLKYLYCYEVTDDLTSEIDNIVATTKLNEIFRNDYLSMNLHEHDIRLESRKEGAAEAKIATAKALIIMGKNTLEEIASACDLPLEQVKQLAGNEVVK